MPFSFGEHAGLCDENAPCERCRVLSTWLEQHLRHRRLAEFQELVASFAQEQNGSPERAAALRTPVDDLDLPGPKKKVLRDDGILTAEDALKHPYRYYELVLPGFGKSSADKLSQALERIGLRLPG